jgi:hypothetical protein
VSRAQETIHRVCTRGEQVCSRNLVLTTTYNELLTLLRLSGQRTSEWDGRTEPSIAPRFAREEGYECVCIKLRKTTPFLCAQMFGKGRSDTEAGGGRGTLRWRPKWMPDAASEDDGCPDQARTPHTRPRGPSTVERATRTHPPLCDKITTASATRVSVRIDRGWAATQQHRRR